MTLLSVVYSKLGRGENCPENTSGNRKGRVKWEENAN